jgi:hypothetical protein
MYSHPYRNSPPLDSHLDWHLLSDHVPVISELNAKFLGRKFWSELEYLVKERSDCLIKPTLSKSQYVSPTSFVDL